MKRVIDNSLLSFLSVKKIDSYQKLRLLLFLHNRPELTGTLTDLAQWLHLGDTVLLERIITDLEAVKLVIQANNHYALSSDPAVQHHLHKLAAAYEDPITRQDIIQHVNGKSSPGSRRSSAFI